jgi:hypothetical protein
MKVFTAVVLLLGLAKADPIFRPNFKYTNVDDDLPDYFEASEKF